MSNFENLKNEISRAIRENGNQEITGDLLQEKLLEMVDSLGKDYKFRGVATPDGQPITDDTNVFYIANEVSVYPNYGGLTVEDGEIAMFCYDGSWSKVALEDVARKSEFEEKFYRLDLEKVINAAENLYDGSSFIDNCYLDDKGQFHNNDEWCVSNFIKVNSQNITLRCNINTYSTICIYDKYKQFIRSIAPLSYTTLYTYQYQDGDCYLRASIHKPDQNKFSVMANYGDDLKNYTTFNPIDKYLKDVPKLQLTSDDYFNKRIKELYLNVVDDTKYYYIYHLQKYVAHEKDYYQFYICVSDDMDIDIENPNVVAHYDNSIEPTGLVKLNGDVGGYAVLDFSDVEYVATANFKGKNTIVNNTLIASLDFNPRISTYLSNLKIESIVSSQYIDVQPTEDYSIELFKEGFVVTDGKIGSSAFTPNYNIYKIYGEAIAKKKDFVFSNYMITAATCDYITVWDSNDNFLGSFATTNFNETPLEIGRHYELLAKCNLYPNISYILLVVDNRYPMPSIYTKVYDNLSFLGPSQNQTDTTIISVDVNGGADFNKISDAIIYSNNNPSTIIYVNPGVYDLVQELGTDYFNEMSNTYYQGLKLGNGVVIKATGDGVIIKAQYNGENVYVGYQFSIFNISGSCEIEGVSFVGENIRYIIHDDLSPAQFPDITNYIVKFKNCTFNHKGSTMYDISQSLPVAVGGGCHLHSIHEWDSCSFLSESSAGGLYDVGYHNGGTANSQSKVIVKNCFFRDGKSFISRRMSSSEGTIDLYLCNNRFGAKISIQETPYLYATIFNNEVYNS